MIPDRDLAVSFARAWTELHPGPRRGWEMLAATGVRGLRILNESGFLTELLLTERHPAAFAVLIANVERYRDRGALPRHHDATKIPEGAPFDYVDLDPYGSPLPFLASALGSLRPGGVLAVTATDMMVLAGVVPGSCERLYGAAPVRGRLAPEAGLRILLANLQRRAEELGRSIVPRLAYVGGHHVRAVVTVEAGASRFRGPVARVDPATFAGPRLPGRAALGPLWVAPLLDDQLVSTMMVPETAIAPGETGRTIERMRSEAPVDCPFTFEPNELAGALKLPEPPPLEAFLMGLMRRGWPAGRSHVRPAAFRTTAARDVVEDLARELSERQSQNARVRA